MCLCKRLGSEQWPAINRVWRHLHRRDQPKFTISQPCRNHGPNPDISLASGVVLTQQIVKCSSSSLWMKRIDFPVPQGEYCTWLLQGCGICNRDGTLAGQGVGGKNKPWTVSVRPQQQMGLEENHPNENCPWVKQRPACKNLSLNLPTQNGCLGLSPSLPGSSVV